MASRGVLGLGVSGGLVNPSPPMTFSAWGLGWLAIVLAYLGGWMAIFITYLVASVIAAIFVVQSCSEKIASSDYPNIP